MTKVLLRLDERVPERGQKRPLCRGPEQRLSQVPERGPRRGQELPLWSRGRQSGADDVRSQMSEARSQKGGTAEM